MRSPLSARASTTWLLPLAPPLVWFAHLSALYGLHAFARLPNFGAVAWGLTGLACLAVGIAWLAARRSLRARSESKDGAGEVAGWLAALSLAGIVFQGLTLVLMPG
jgi:hypothetical protein